MQEHESSDYYVYLHRRLSDGRIFYVGKGLNRRYLCLNGRSNWWNNTAQKHGVSPEILIGGLCEDDAKRLEIIIIADLRSSGEPLVNLTSGGDGAPDRVLSAETLEIMSKYKRKAVTNSDGMCFPSMKEAALWLNENGFPTACSACISQSIQNPRRSAYGRIWWYSTEPDRSPFDPRKVLALEQGKKIMRDDGMIFPSVSHAARYIAEEQGRPVTRANISNCANGRIKTSYGHKWRFVDDNC